MPLSHYSIALVHRDGGDSLLTWLDHTCRQALTTVNEKWHGGDPRKAMAYHIGREIQGFHNGMISKNILEECFTVILSSFIAEFMPAGSPLLLNGEKPKRPLGLLLTRETANLLSNANPLNIPDAMWHEALGDRAIYVDVPHGAIVMHRGGTVNEVIELRAILAAPFLPPNAPGQTLFIAQMTKRASEESCGRIGGILMPDGMVSRFGSQTMPTAADWTMKPPFAHSLLEKAVLGRAGSFLRLVLAYHFFGPKEAREPISATPTERLRAGKPRNEQSLFALTRLRASHDVQRPKNTILSSWSLTSRQEVTGHFKLQAFGPQHAFRRLTWIEPYQRGPEDAPVRPQGYQV